LAGRGRRLGGFETAVGALLAGHRVHRPAFGAGGLGHKPTVQADRERLFSGAALRAGFGYFLRRWGAKTHGFILLIILAIPCTGLITLSDVIREGNQSEFLSSFIRDMCCSANRRCSTYPDLAKQIFR
jgi:hypothetical protein